MISWFARFKNRFEQLQTYHQKYIEKSDAQIIDKSSNIDEKGSQNPSKNYKKTRSKKLCKKGAKKGSAPWGPGAP